MNKIGDKHQNSPQLKLALKSSKQVSEQDNAKQRKPLAGRNANRDSKLSKKKTAYNTEIFSALRVKMLISNCDILVSLAITAKFSPATAAVDLKLQL